MSDPFEGHTADVSSIASSTTGSVSSRAPGTKRYRSRMSRQGVSYQVTLKATRTMSRLSHSLLTDVCRLRLEVIWIWGGIWFFEGYANRVNSVAFPPYGKRVVSGSADRPVQI